MALTGRNARDARSASNNEARELAQENPVTPSNGRKPDPTRRPASQLSGSFNLNGYSYPEDLTGNPAYGGNYVVFYISVHEDSYLASPDRVSEVPLGGTIRDNGIGDLSEASINTIITGASVGAVVGTGAASALVSKVTGREMSSGGKTVADAVGGGVLAGVAINSLGGTKKEMRTLKNAIALYIPNDLQIKYGVQWGETDTAGLVALGSGLDAIGGVGDSFLGGAASYITSKALQTPGVGGFLSKTSGVAANPKKEQIFQSVDFRTFSFTYQFFPRSKSESDAVQEIIRQFKLHMHPEYKDVNRFLYIYPSEFDIRYYNNGVENLNIHRHTSCVLTDMNVMYTPQGVYTAFEGGAPSQINVTLTFRELAQLSKETIEDGY
jgi:hypothetical protein